MEELNNEYDISGIKHFVEGVIDHLYKPECYDEELLDHCIEELCYYLELECPQNKLMIQQKSNHTDKLFPMFLELTKSYALSFKKNPHVA